MVFQSDGKYIFEDPLMIDNCKIFPDSDDSINRCLIAPDWSFHVNKIISSANLST